MLRPVRQDAASELRIASRKRNEDVMFAVMPSRDPARSFVVAPLVRYARELGRAAQPGKDSCTLAFSGLERGFSQVCLDGSTVSNWGDVRGLFGAALLSARRIGWQFASRVALKDRVGTELSLFEVPPCEFACLAEEAYMLSCASRSFASLIGGVEDAPVLLRLLISVCHSERLSAKQRFSLCRQVAGGAFPI